MRRVYIMVLSCAVLAASAPALHVYAQASADYTERIRNQCGDVKQVIQAQRKHDLVARINRGRAYQTLIDQQRAFAERLGNNQLNADAFESQADTVRAGVDRFRSAYNTYDDTVGTLLAIDCAEKPADFIAKLQSVRGLRAAIGSEVVSISGELQKYREITVQLQGQLERLGGAQ